MALVWRPKNNHHREGRKGRRMKVLKLIVIMIVIERKGVMEWWN